MTRVCVVCEGPTEETFVRDVLAPHFAPQGLYLEGQGINTSPGHRGGALKYERVKLHLRNTLRQSSGPVVTTMFDLYALDKGFPGFEQAAQQADLASQAGHPVWHLACRHRCHRRLPARALHPTHPAA